MMEGGNRLIICLLLCSVLISGCSINKKNEPPIDIFCEEFNTGRYDVCDLISLDLYYIDNDYFFEVSSIEKSEEAFNGQPIEVHVVYAIGSQMGWFTPEFYEIQDQEELYRGYCYAKAHGTHYVYSDDELRKIEKKLNP